MLQISSLKQRREVLASIDSNDTKAIEKILRDPKYYKEYNYSEYYGDNEPVTYSHGTHEDREILRYAILNDKPEIVAVLTKYIYPDEDALSLAVENASIEMLTVLLRKTEALSFPNVAVLRALEKGRLEEAKVIMKTFRVCFDSDDLIDIASNSSFESVVYALPMVARISSVLVEIGAKNYRGFIFIIAAALQNGIDLNTLTLPFRIHPTAVKYYAKVGPDEHLRRLLSCMYKPTDLPAARVLIEKGFKPTLHSDSILTEYYIDMGVLEGSYPRPTLEKVDSIAYELIDRYL